MSVIFIHNKCNNNCFMCPHPDSLWKTKPHFDLFHLLKKLDEFHRGKTEHVKEGFSNTFYVSGGEPTLSPHLFTIIKKITSYFPEMKVNCLSNGRRFSYVDYTRKALGLNANLELAIAIHGHNAKIHDMITRTPGSFNQTVKGLKNILRFRKPTQLIELRVVIHRMNYKFLAETMNFIKKNFPGIDRLVFIFFEIEGQATKHFKKLSLTYRQLAPFIEKLYDLISAFSDVRFSHFPLCTLAAKFFPYVYKTLPEYEVVFLESCKLCNLRAFCTGIHKSYLKHMDPLEFRPISNKIDIRTSSDWDHPIKGVNYQ